MRTCGIHAVTLVAPPNVQGSARQNEKDVEGILLTLRGAINVITGFDGGSTTNVITERAIGVGHNSAMMGL